MIFVQYLINKKKNLHEKKLCINKFETKFLTIKNRALTKYRLINSGILSKSGIQIHKSTRLQNQPGRKTNMSNKINYLSGIYGTRLISTRVKIHPINILYFSYLLIYFIIFLIFFVYFLFIFPYHYYPYPQLVSGS